MFKKFDVNTVGNDYICSDIHGFFHLLEEELNKANFNEEKDRLFSLGDLIDRGDESHLVADWIEKPWFHAIQGNHENMFLESYENGFIDQLENSGVMGCPWTKALDDPTLEKIYHSLSSLPIAIE